LVATAYRVSTGAIDDKYVFESERRDNRLAGYDGVTVIPVRAVVVVKRHKIVCGESAD